MAELSGFSTCSKQKFMFSLNTRPILWRMVLICGLFIFGKTKNNPEYGSLRHSATEMITLRYGATAIQPAATQLFVLSDLLEFSTPGFVQTKV